ncbi:hypothetical protein [Kutzneria sp. CA-103260]|nr:hypothetical protein [Kutzneria sp. CA-103260]QUQ66091.1 hypothetical protein JJ691_38170 [Kutzneria sp. CA-103260]
MRGVCLPDDPADMAAQSGATRLDMDVEDASLTNAAGIDRRNKALRETED